MPNIVFASNNISHFPNTLAGSVVGTFDDNRVPYTIALSNYEEAHSPTFAATVGDSTWFHFRTFCSDDSLSGSRTLLKAYDADDNVLFDIVKITNRRSMDQRVYIYDGSSPTVVQDDGTTPLTRSKPNAIDVHYETTNLLLRVSIYVNGQLSASAQYNANPEDYGPPVRFTMGTPFTTSMTGVQHYSEFIVADGDTRNARLDLLRPASAGAYEEWTGSLASLADDDTTTGMTTITDGQKQTVNLSPYAGASNVSNVVLTSQTTRGQNSPTKIRHMVRQSGVDYPGDTLDVEFGFQFHLQDLKINPATSLAWEGSDLSLIETGFESIA